ncbi:hypothetical protein [Haladaptatus sp. NG-WS-4]
MGPAESLAGVVIWLLVLAVAAFFLNGYLVAVSFEVVVTLFALGGVLTLLVFLFLGYFCTDSVF